MKNKIIVFAITMLLPSLAWACGGGPDLPFGELDIVGKILFMLTRLNKIVLPVFLIAFIVLSLVIAFKKNQEKKKLSLGIVLAVVFLFFNIAAGFLGSSAGYLLFYPTVILILILDLKCIKDKSEKRMKWWIIIAFSVSLLSLLAIIVETAAENSLCGGSAF